MRRTTALLTFLIAVLASLALPATRAMAGGAATHLAVTNPDGSTPGTATIGQPVTIKVTALDSTNATATGYTGSIRFSTSDLTAQIPPDYQFTGAENGVQQFTVTFNTTGTKTITATDKTTSTIKGTETFTVSAPPPGPAVVLSLDSEAFAIQGVATPVTVTALDENFQKATSYTGTIHFTAPTDGKAILPADYTFTGADAGEHVFSVTWGTPGDQSATATDTSTASITGDSPTTDVSDASVAASFDVDGPAEAVLGTPVHIDVTARDGTGGLASGYEGTVHLTSSDGAATLPGDYTFTIADGGHKQFTVTFATLGDQTITATDTGDDTIDGTSDPTSVQKKSKLAATLVVKAPKSAVHGTPVNVKVSALDKKGKVAKGYRGTVHFTSTDSSADLPDDYSFTAADAGVHTFQVTFSGAGKWKVVVTDTVKPTITGKSTTVVS